MPKQPVAQLASDLKMTAADLLEVLQRSGVTANTTNDLLSENDKSKLLEYLRRSQGKTNIKTVAIRLRKKTVLVKHDTALLHSKTLIQPINRSRPTQCVISLRKKPSSFPRGYIRAISLATGLEGPYKDNDGNERADLSPEMQREMAMFLCHSASPWKWMPPIRWKSVGAATRAEIKWVMAPYAEARTWLRSLESRVKNHVKKNKKFGFEQNLAEHQIAEIPSAPITATVAPDMQKRTPDHALQDERKILRRSRQRS